MRQILSNHSNISLKKNSGLSLLLCASAAFVLLQASDAYAVEVTAGSISIDTSTPNVTTYNQSSNTGILTYRDRGFDTSKDESRIFNQPSSSSATLIRIKLTDLNDKNPLNYDGKLTANGKIMIVDPNGVFFGPNSRVDVASLVASTADTSDENFLAGKINLSIAGKANASIVNKGNITAAQGGLVALVAPSVRNDGVIQANMGTVALASAETASVDFYGDNLYSFALNKETSAAANNTDAAVTNNGIISVGGGKVILTAKVAKDVVDNVINNTGIIEASSAHMEGGTVVLDGMDGNVNVSGTINASSATGGKVTVTGKNITLAAANINASGKNGGGSVKIGGDYQGGGTTPHAKTVKIDANSTINVSATDAGNGGTSIVWSDELTDFNGSILGTGGVNGGNGGFAEVSSKGELGYNGSADLHATSGNSGTLLLDPNSLFIGSFVDHFFGTDHFVNFAPIVSTLNGGTNVIATALNNVSVLSNIIWTGAGSLTLTAGQNIVISANVKSAFNGTNSQGAITFNAGNTAYINSIVSSVGGDITTNSVGVSVGGGSMKSTLSNVIVNNTGKFVSNLANVLEGKSVTLRQNTAGSIQNAINAVGNTGIGGALLQLGNGVWNQVVNINQGNFTVKGNGAANTTINAPSVLSNVITVGTGINDVTVSDLTISGGAIGVNLTSNARFKLNNSVVKNTSTAGLRSTNTNGSVIANNTFSNNLMGMNFTGDKNLIVGGNNLSGVIPLPDSDLETDGIRLKNVVTGQVANNYFSLLHTGIDIHGGNYLTIDSNNMNTAGLNLSGWLQFGIMATGSSNLTISNNAINGADSLGGVAQTGWEAIHVIGGLNNVIDHNVTDWFDTHIIVENSINTDITFNGTGYTVTDSILLIGNTDTLVSNNYVWGATNYGINSLLNNNIIISNNDINGTFAGIYSSGDSFLSILGNTLSYNSTGASISGSNGAIINNNTIYGSGTYVNDNGVVVDTSDGVTLSGNNFSNAAVGASFWNSNNATLTGNVFNDNGLGISLDNSQNTLIAETTITFPTVLGTGIGILNGSGGTLVRGLNITDGYTGIWLDGLGSSMQFVGNASIFNNQYLNFDLSNSAMSGEILDASAQTFGGTRASDFTLAQRDAAEDITFDVKYNPTVGDVFYKNF